MDLTVIYQGNFHYSPSLVTADQSCELISLLCRLSGVEPALRTNGRQVRNSVPLRVEAKGPGLTLDRCHCAVNCEAFRFRESRSFVLRRCRNSDDDLIFVHVDNAEVRSKNVFQDPAHVLNMIRHLEVHAKLGAVSVREKQHFNDVLVYLDEQNP